MASVPVPDQNVPNGGVGNHGSSSEKTEMGNCGHCKKSTTKMCSHCKKVFYCSTDCQKSHRKKHKGDCYPAKIIRDQGALPYMIATRDIHEGEVIFTEIPILRTVEGRVLPEFAKLRLQYLPACLTCMKNLKPQGSYICPECKWPMCGEECAKHPDHRDAECPIFKAQNFGLDGMMTQYNMVTTIRCALMKTKNPRKWAQIMDIVPQVDTNLNEADKKFEAEQLTQGFWMHKLMFGIHDLTQAEFIHIAQVCKTQRTRPNAALFTHNFFVLKYLISFTGHSCSPNILSAYSGNIDDPAWKSTTMATRKIEKGEKLTNSMRTPYVMDGTIQRAEWMKFNAFGYECKCERCIDPTELGTFIQAIKCEGKAGARHTEEEFTKNLGYLLPINPLDTKSDWKCNSRACNLIVKVSEILYKVNPMGHDIVAFQRKCNQQNFEVFYGKDVDPKDDELIRQMEEYVKNCRKVLHPNHFVIMTMEQKILNGMSSCLCTPQSKVNPQSQFYGLQGKLEAAERMQVYANHCVEVVEKLMPPLDLFTGKMLYFQAVAIQTWLTLTWARTLATMARDGGTIFDARVFQPLYEKVPGIFKRVRAAFGSIEDKSNQNLQEARMLTCLAELERHAGSINFFGIAKQLGFTPPPPAPDDEAKKDAVEKEEKNNAQKENS